MSSARGAPELVRLLDAKRAVGGASRMDVDPLTGWKGSIRRRQEIPRQVADAAYLPPRTFNPKGFKSQAAHEALAQVHADAHEFVLHLDVDVIAAERVSRG